MSSDAGTQDLLIESLKRGDEERRAGRAERIGWVGQYEISGGIIIGSVEVIHLLQEARNCFVEGQYIATLILATSVIEHWIIEEFLDRKIAFKPLISFEKTIAKAREEDLFNSELLDGADKLRLIRNPYAHRQIKDTSNTLGSRFIENKSHPISIIEADAKEALIVMYGHFRYAIKSV